MTYGYVYMLRCSDNSLYTGWCKNIDDRLNKHNSGLGAKYTRSRRPCKLVFFKEINSKSEALKLEIKLKNLKKEYKENIVRNFQNKNGAI
ncbi:GIY-YIG nuclease family protein [Anaerococcus sp. AGMB00486]|uniref:GIY-YIG nuclease family protein n=2 Tax=Anaerococcus TaxID=165779 RepID=A0ABX2N8K1_9FIRM|nr:MULTISPECIES: GIY-YIG nuclease family protein [Anaerococcus]MDY3006209.1 GIY-YIG nuclease family protein [Anaerococcus porci]MSS77181.1 GIY-YIG nuclease family protein [Anaerococcus porci]NVF11014.1 GIY-YIG nuclease family protein [Anaerococcus faecalis]